MAYDIHITRRNNWFDKEGPVISEEEWKKVVEEDSELKLTDYAESSLKNKPFEIVRLKKHLMGLLSDPITKKDFYFVYSPEKITVSDAEENVVEKMKQVAQKLDAKVQGDEGELY